MAGGLALKSVLLALPMRLYLRSHVLTGYRAPLTPTYRLLYVRSYSYNTIWTVHFSVHGKL